MIESVFYFPFCHIGQSIALGAIPEHGKHLAFLLSPGARPSDQYLAGVGTPAHKWGTIPVFHPKALFRAASRVPLKDLQHVRDLGRPNTSPSISKPRRYIYGSFANMVFVARGVGCTLHVTALSSVTCWAPAWNPAGATTEVVTAKGLIRAEAGRTEPTGEDP